MKSLTIESFVKEMYNVPYNSKFEKATEKFLMSHGAKIIKEPNGGNTFPDFSVTIDIGEHTYSFDIEEKTNNGKGKPNFNAHYPQQDDFYLYVNPHFSMPFLGKHLPLASDAERKRIKKFWAEEDERFKKFSESCKGFLVPRNRIGYTPKAKTPVNYKEMFADPKVYKDVVSFIRKKRID